MSKIILPIFLISFLFSCNNIQKEKESNDFPKQELHSKEAKYISKKFIGQAYRLKSDDSFGQQTQTFVFEKNGQGHFTVNWTVYGKYHEDKGELFWKVIDDEIHLNYTYRSSDGIVSNEKEIFEYDEVKNQLVSTRSRSEIFNCVSSKVKLKNEIEYDAFKELIKKNSNFWENVNLVKSESLVIKTIFSSLEEKGIITRQNEIDIYWEFYFNNSEIQLYQHIKSSTHKYTGKLIKGNYSRIELLRADGTKYCDLEIVDLDNLLELRLYFSNGEIWYNEINIYGC